MQVAANYLFAKPKKNIPLAVSKNFLTVWMKSKQEEYQNINQVSAPRGMYSFNPHGTSTETVP